MENDWLVQMIFFFCPIRNSLQVNIVLVEEESQRGEGPAVSTTPPSAEATLSRKNKLSPSSHPLILSSSPEEEEQKPPQAGSSRLIGCF